MPWQRARVDERCGFCTSQIFAGEAVFAFFPGGLARSRRLVRCRECGERLTDTRPGDELAYDTTAPQPSFVPVERLPNVVTESDLQRRRGVAVARVEQWRRRHGAGPR